VLYQWFIEDHPNSCPIGTGGSYPLG